MIISLCGDEHDKHVVIQELQKVYGERLLIINYFKEVFNERIINERLRNSLSLFNFNEIIYKNIHDKVNNIINNNQDKIILLISNNILEKDVDKLPWFKLSKIKILVTSNKKINQNDLIWGHQVLYSKDDFDYIVNPEDRLIFRKLVRDL